MISLKALLENIHKPDLISESNDQVEATGMECNRVGLICEGLTNIKRRRIGVVPDPDRLIDRACGDEILLDACVHTLNGSAMERANEVLIFRVIKRLLDIDIDFHNLIVLSCENDALII